MKILNKFRIDFEKSLSDIVQYLSTTYNQNKNVFTKSSPFFQIIEVIVDIKDLIFYYIEDSINELNLQTAQRTSSIYGLSRLAGHNPTRAISAKGEVSITIRSGKSSNIIGSKLVLPKYLRLRCNNNSLIYLLNPSTSQIEILKNGSDAILCNILQGEFQTQTFISNGEPLQSFNVQNKRNTFIDNDIVIVTVNGQEYKQYQSLYDIPNNSFGCLVKTGINGGIDVYFGNGYFGQIPPIGSYIDISYLETQGFSGNINAKSNVIEFEFIDGALDNLGNDIDLNDTLNISVSNPIIFGSNGEGTDFTKMIAPMASQTFVLANETNYIYFLERLNLFSHIEAFNTFGDDNLYDDNIIYLFLISDVRNRASNGRNYWDLTISDFILDSFEKERLKNLINQSGQQLISSEIFVIEPFIKKYAINIYLKVFKGYNYATLSNSIKIAISDYLISFERRDFMPKSDLIRLIEGIEYVDSVNVQFISEENELAQKNGFYIQKEYIGMNVIETKIEISDNVSIGLDEYGDIQLSKFDILDFYGGFYDRYGQYYDTKFNNSNLSPLNITITKEI